MCFYESVDFSQCVDLRVVHIGTVTLNHVFSATMERMLSLVSTMWKFLSAVPSHCIEEVVFGFDPDRESVEEIVAELGRFPWLELVACLQKMFRNLKTISLRLYGAYAGRGRAFNEALRQAGLGDNLKKRVSYGNKNCKVGR